MKELSEAIALTVFAAAFWFVVDPHGFGDAIHSFLAAAGAP